MPKLFLLAALSFSFAVTAQVTRDANPRDKQNTRDGDVNAEALDPATKARIRAEGAAGGTGARIPPEARGPAMVTNGRQNRHSQHKEDPPLGVPPKVEVPVEREVLGPREK
jgi:hypothetical protein